jgi:probable rRNA maturation factor
MTIDVSNETSYAVDERSLVELARFVLDRLRIHPGAELSLLLVDAPAMAALHQHWMDEEGPTDVMSFPMDELRPAAEDEAPAAGLLGDVVLCPEVAERQAREAGHSTGDELALLTIHGILHLLGHDHGEEAERTQMFSLQDELLAAWRRRR